VLQPWSQFFRLPTATDWPTLCSYGTSCVNTVSHSAATQACLAELEQIHFDCKLPICNFSCLILAHQPAVMLARLIVTLCGCIASVPQQQVCVIMTMSMHVGLKLQHANTMLPAQTLMFAFAVCLLHSSCFTAVAELFGGYVVDRQCWMTVRIWTGLICTHYCRPLQTRIFIKQCQAKTRLADAVHPLACSIAEIVTGSFLLASARQCGLLPCCQVAYRNPRACAL